MDFPQDVWGNIMTHFHSPYRRPPHYDAMIETPSFYFSRQRYRNATNRRLDLRPSPAGWHSYYERLVTTDNDRVRLRRGVAPTGAVQDDFVEMFRIFRTRNRTNQADLICYLP